VNYRIQSRSSEFLYRSALLFLFGAFFTPHRLLAQASQSVDAPPSQQQPASEPAKKGSSTTAAPASAAAQKPVATKPHRVFTNDDISTAPSVPVPPGARRRLKQLNRCDRTCFYEVEKQALGWGYTTAFPRSTRQDMEDRLANDIEELRNAPKWQQLLLNLISARLNRCAQSQHPDPNPENSPSHVPTREEILAEEARARNYRPSPGTDVNAADSAVLAYRFNTHPDPLKASLMVHQYMDELHQTCAVQYASSDSDDPDDP
jgi:hypothetical protein